jgi:hypothetical protein
VGSNRGERNSEIQTVGGAKKELILPRDQRQQVVGRRLGGDDAGGAHVDGRAQEHVELRAVIQRQRVQHHVVRRDAGVHGAARVLPQHCVMGQHRALGAGLGAARVDDLGQVHARQLGGRHRAIGAGELLEGRHPGHRLRRLLRGQPHELLHGGVQRRGAAGGLGQAGIGGQRLRLRVRVPQDVSHLFGLEHEVDRHQHRAQAGQRETQCHERVRVAGQHGHPAGVAHAQARQPCRHPVAHRVELGECPTRVAANDGALAGIALGAAMQQVGDRLPADGGVHGLSL